MDTIKKKIVAQEDRQAWDKTTPAAQRNLPRTLRLEPSCFCLLLETILCHSTPYQVAQGDS